MKRTQLGVFENGVLRMIFGPTRVEVEGTWRRLHIYEPHQILLGWLKHGGWGGRHVVRIGETRNAYKILVGERERKIPLGRPRRRREDNIIMDLKKIEWEIVDWIQLAECRDRWRADV